MGKMNSILDVMEYIYIWTMSTAILDFLKPEYKPISICGNGGTLIYF